MDGMLVVAFFFPLILCASVVASVGGFFMSIYLSFGDRIADALQVSLRGYVPESVLSVGLAILRHPPLKAYGWIVYPVVINIVVASTVLGTYSLGKVLYHKRGWKPYQPLRGGVRFVLLQATLWTVFSISLILPWLSLQDIGMLHLAGRVKPSTEDRDSFGGLLVASAALGMISESLVIVALMVFDSSSSGGSSLSINARRFSRTDLALFDTGRWNFKMLFGQSSRKFWWVFIGLQSSMAIYACAIAFLSESEAIADGPVQGLLLMVFVSLYAVAMALTNAVGGKWRYGEDKYHIFMPGRGGLVFAFVQGVAWMMFSCVWLVVLAKLVSITFEAKTLTDKGIMATAGTLGVISQFLIALSLLIFDPKRAGRSTLAAGLGTADSRAPNDLVAEAEPRGAATSMGRRQGGQVRPGRHWGALAARSLATGPGSEAETAAAPDEFAPAQSLEGGDSRGSPSFSPPSSPRQIASMRRRPAGSGSVRRRRRSKTPLARRAAPAAGGAQSAGEGGAGLALDSPEQEASSSVRRRRRQQGESAGQQGRQRSKSPAVRSRWKIHQIIGNRSMLDVDARAGRIEYLVQWDAPEARTEWCSVDDLAAKVAPKVLRATLDVYRAQRAAIAQSSDVDDDDDDDDDGDHQDNVGNVASGLEGKQDELEFTGNDEVEGSSDDNNVHTTSGSVDSKSGEQEWEELEDDQGNVYYYCVTTETVHADYPRPSASDMIA